MELDKMKELLQQDEAARLARNDMVREEGTSWKKINSVDPLSQAMKDEVTNYLAFRNAKNNNSIRTCILAHNSQGHPVGGHQPIQKIETTYLEKYDSQHVGRTHGYSQEIVE
jgi:hypothetical protein